MIRNIGYCCINNSLRGTKNNEVYTSRSVTLKTFNLKRIEQLSLQNCKDLLTILKWNLQNKIFSFRVGSNFFPFITHPEVGYSLHQLTNFSEIEKALKEAGDFARQNGMRLNCHPGPMTIISSPREEVVTNAIKDLEHHAEISKLLGDFDTLFTINIHVGGPYGDKKATSIRFCENFKRLSDYTRQRLTIENDDKLSGYTVEDLYSMVPNIPIVYDDHHHQLNSGTLSRRDAAMLAFSTWKDIPEIHYSEPRTHPKDRAHADFGDNLADIVPEYTYDVSLETKAKEESVLRLRGLPC